LTNEDGADGVDTEFTTWDRIALVEALLLVSPLYTPLML
jgi:hypothetical protein